MFLCSVFLHISCMIVLQQYIYYNWNLFMRYTIFTHPLTDMHVPGFCIGMTLYSICGVYNKSPISVFLYQEHSYHK